MYSVRKQLDAKPPTTGTPASLPGLHTAYKHQHSGVDPVRGEGLSQPKAQPRSYRRGAEPAQRAPVSAHSSIEPPVKKQAVEVTEIRASENCATLLPQPTGVVEAPIVTTNVVSIDTGSSKEWVIYDPALSGLMTLPDELLCYIMSFFYHPDFVKNLFCLRNVSHRFRLLLDHDLSSHLPTFSLMRRSFSPFFTTVHELLSDMTSEPVGAGAQNRFRRYEAETLCAVVRARARCGVLREEDHNSAIEGPQTVIAAVTVEDYIEKALARLKGIVVVEGQRPAQVGADQENYDVSEQQPLLLVELASASLSHTRKPVTTPTPKGVGF
ncbi:MAG: hypothetical protein JSR97_09715 [Verrucomicrobia bacterium]|nr:hypothetical protein [Verrucomicrobiota bacterium]